MKTFFEDHPRVCGEKENQYFQWDCAAGSPPRVRGKDKILLISIGFPGITPACAGKSFWPAFAILLGGDHPRVCGEKACHFMLPGLLLGSPPRVRGKD